MTARVPVIALTGHLGAVKTSLLNHLLRAPGARLGVIVNDFGELNVDAALVSGQVIDAVAHFQTVNTRETPPNRFAAATLVVIGLQGGQKGELPIGLLMGKGAWVTGSTLRSQPVRQKTEIMRQVVQHVWPLVESGAIRPQVDRTFPLDQAAAAHEHLETSERTGKVLLVP